MTYSIYLVDDDRFLLDLYAVKFKNAGHEVKVFSGGEDLLETLRKEDTCPDAILLDLIMPGMDGFAVLEAVRREHLALKARIIILSNQGQEADLEKAKLFGAAGYIIKASALPSEVLGETVSTIEKTKV
jgi:DNA-binding response OmpR family regulator